MPNHASHTYDVRIPSAKLTSIRRTANLISQSNQDPQKAFQLPIRMLATYPVCMCYSSIGLAPYDTSHTIRYSISLQLSIHHLYLAIWLIIYQPESDNCFLQHYHLKQQLSHHLRNRHYVVLTLKDLYNPDLQLSLKYAVLPPIVKTTAKCLTMNQNGSEIRLLPISLLVPQLRRTTYLPIHDQHRSY